MTFFCAYEKHRKTYEKLLKTNDKLQKTKKVSYINLLTYNFIIHKFFVHDIRIS